EHRERGRTPREPRAPGHQHRAGQPENGLLDLHRVGVPPLRLADRHLPGVQGAEPGRAVPARTFHREREAGGWDPGYPADLAEHLRAADELAGDGAGALRRAAGGPQGGHHLAVRHGGAGPDLPGLPGVRVQPLRPRRSDDADQPVREHLLPADGVPRGPRAGGGDLPEHAGDHGGAPPARPGALHERGDRRPVLALRGRDLDRDLRPRLPDQV
ncbi:MAG: Cytochrome c oxidase polypeptide III, partial [uncultured Gemmatimonadetes bacterium]